MLGNIVFSLNHVFPFFLMIVIGAGLRHFQILPGDFFKSLNRFVYRVALPTSLFYSCSRISWAEAGEGGFIFYLWAGTIGCYAVIWICSEIFIKDKTVIGTFVQSSFRGNYLLLGTPVLLSILGERALSTTSMIAAFIIPTYGVLSIFVLSARNGGGQPGNIPTLLKNVLTNPMIIGAVAGTLWSLTPFQFPFFVTQTLSYVGASATSMGLISVGGIFDWTLAKNRIKISLVASSIKLIVQPGVMVAVSYLIGIRGENLFYVFILFANPCATAVYSVASELNGDGPLASNTLIITTVLSALTMAAGITLMRTAGWI